jgi:hypothetical protein
LPVGTKPTGNGGLFCFAQRKQVQVQLYKYVTNQERKFVESRVAEIWAEALNLANELNNGKLVIER